MARNRPLPREQGPRPANPWRGRPGRSPYPKSLPRPNVPVRPLFPTRPPPMPRVPLPRFPVPIPGGAGLLRIPARFVPGIGWGLLGYEIYKYFYPDPEFLPYPAQEPIIIPKGFYIWRDCGRRPGSPPFGTPPGLTPTGPRQNVHYNVWHDALICDQGRTQWNGTVPLGTPFTPVYGKMQIDIKAGALAPDGRHQARGDVYLRKDDNVTIDPVDAKVVYAPTRYIPSSPAAPPMPDPNWVRGMPGPIPQPNPYEAPNPDLPTDPADWQASPGNQPLPRVHARRPPSRFEQEKKSLSKAARVGIFLWRMFDNFSEFTEIGGAFYDALPDDVRRKAKCGDGTSTFGQYGSDVDACMLETLWNNLDKLDTAEAFKNIAKNVVQDMTIGQFHKWLAKVTPDGVSIERTVFTHGVSRLQAEAYIAKKLEELFDALGL